MAMDVSTITVKVESKGIDSTTTSLGKLEERAGTTERAVTSLMEKMQKSSAYVLAVVESMNQLRAAMNGAIQVNAISGASAELKKMHEELAKIQSSLGKGVGKGITVNIKEIGDSNKEAVKGVESLNQSLAKGQNIFQMFGKELYHIRNLLGGTMLAGTMIDAAKGAITLADAWSLAGARLKIFVNSVEMAAAQQERLFQVSQELKVPMQSLTTLFTRLVPAMAEYGYNTQSAMDVTKSMAAALKVSGATAAETSSVLLQFSQSMAAGRLNGAEFNAVAEGAPIVLRMLSEELGVSRGALKKMASDGLLPTSVLANVLKNNLEKLSDTAKEMPTTVGAAIDMLSDSFSRFVGKLNDGTGVTGLIAKTIKLLADNLEFLAKVVGTVVTGFIAYNVALGAYNLIVASSTALSAALAAELGIVAAASGMAAGAAGMLGAALKFIMANPIILALSAAAAALVFFSDKLFETSDAAKVASEETEKALANNDFATAVKKQQEEATRLSEKYSLLSAELVRLQAEQKKAKESGWATKGQAEVIENLTKQVDALKKSWDKATASVKQYQDQQKLEAIKLSTGDMDEYTNKMEKEISLGHKMTKGEEALWKAQKARADLSKTASAETVRAFDANVDSANKAIEVEKRYKKVIEDTKAAKKEGESFTKKYDKEIEKINLFIAKQDEELNSRTKLTEAQAMSVKISEFIENNNKKLATSEKTRLGLAQDAILTKGVEIELRKAEVKTLELLQDRYYKEQDTLLASKESMRLTNQEMQRKMELLEMAKVGVQESAVGEQLYAIRQNEAALASVNEAKGIREKALALADVRAKMAQTPEEQALAQKEISMLKDKIDALNAQAAALSNLIPQQKKQLEVLTDLAKITMLDIGRSPGQILADGFGEAGKAISEMTTAYTKFGDEATKIDKYVADKQAALMAQGMGKKDARIEAEKDVADKRIQVNAEMYASLAGAAKGFFSENSKGYQAMAKAEKAFRVIELAMATKTALTKMALMGETLATYLFGIETATAATVASVAPVAAAEAAKAQAAGATSVANAAQMPGPLAFAGAAAMIALLAGIGVSLGGGSSSPNLSAQRQSSQGTGTVFGDSSAKSESAVKALELVADNSEISLSYNAGMLASLKNIESALVGVAKLVVRGGVQGQVGFAEGMGSSKASLGSAGANVGSVLVNLMPGLNAIVGALFSVKKSVVDSGLVQSAQSLTEIMSSGLAVKGYTDIETKKKKFGKTKTSTETNLSDLSTELEDQLTKVVLGLGDSMSQAAKALKLDGDSFTSTLDSFVVDIGRISIQGMDAKQIQETLTNVFSKLGDEMAAAVMPGFIQFQGIGEGYMETLVRVASTVATVDGIFAEVGTTFGTTGMEAVKAKMDLVELAGGIQELSSMVGNFFDKFYTEAEKKAVAVTNITTKMADLGVQGFDPLAENARVVFRTMVENAKETSPKLMVELLKLSDAVDKVAPAFKEAADAADITAQKVSLQTRIQELTLSKEELLVISRQKELDSMDASLKPLQERIYALEDEKVASEKSLAILNKKAELEDKILGLTLSKTNYLNITRQKEIDKLDESLKPLQERIYALEDEKVAIEKAKELAKESSALNLRIQELTLDSTSYLALVRERELATLDESLKTLKLRIYALEDEKAAIESLKELVDKLKASAGNALNVLEKSINAEKEVIKKSFSDKMDLLKSQQTAEDAAYEVSRKLIEDQQNSSKEIYEAQFSSYKSQIDLAKSASDNLKSLFEDIDDAINSVVSDNQQLISASYVTAKQQLEDTLSAAQSGGSLPDAKSFQSTLKSVSNIDPTKFGSLFDFQKEQLQTVGKLSQLKGIVGKGVEEQDLVISAIESTSIGIEKLKVATETAAENALIDLDKKHKEALVGLDSQMQLLQQQYDADVLYFDNMMELARRQLEKAEGTYQATLSVEDALRAFNINLSSYIEANSVSSRVATMGMKTSGLSSQSSQENNNLVQEIQTLRQELAAQNRAIAQNTSTTAKILSQWDGDGQPETRVF